MEVFIDHPNTETWKGNPHKNFVSAYLASLPSRESTGVSDSAHYQQISPDQHGFRPDHSTTSALLQMTTYIAMGFNKRKPPDRTICVAVDSSAAFDRVCHNNVLSKINISQLPPAKSRWLSCYQRGRHAKTCFRGVKSTSMKVNTGVPQGSTLSPSLFSFYS